MATTRLAQLAERLPSATSPDYGTPFYDIFKRTRNDFYKIDPMLFSPAEVWLTSATSGRTFHAGQPNIDVLQASLFELMMRVIILSARTGWHTDELIRALTERGHLAAVVPYEGLTAKFRLSDVEAGLQTGLASAETRLTSEQISLLDADVVLARIIPGGSLEQLIYRVDALHWIENRGVPVVNSPRAIERSSTSSIRRRCFMTLACSCRKRSCERVEDAMAAVRAMGDVVIKPIFGSLGHGMVRVSDPETALRVVRALDQIKSVFYAARHRSRGTRPAHLCRRRSRDWSDRASGAG